MNMKRNIFSTAICVFAFAAAISAQAKPTPPPAAPACGEPVIMSVEIEKDGNLSVTKNCRYETALPSGETHRLWKEYFGVKDGKIVLLKTVEGRVVPARIEWMER